MRSRLAIYVLLALLVLLPAPAPAQDTEALRRELEQMRKQFEAMKQEQQKMLDAMAERLRQLESAPSETAARPPAAPSGPVAAPAPAGQPAGPPTLGEYLQPRQPFSLAERSGGGRLLFDMGVAADFIGNLTSNNVDRADAGTFSGRENRFFPREVELSLFGQIDPYARGVVIIEAAEEFEDGARDLHVGLAEAHLTLLTLPFGTQAKLGLVRNRFGLLNEFHAHDLPQPDRPNVLVRFFGEEGLNESGLEFTWVPPLPFYLELLGGVFNGDNDTAFGRASLRDPLVTGRARTFFELGDVGAIQLGASVASGETEEHLRQTFVGIDAKYKYTPTGWRHPLLTLAGEGIWSFRKVNVEDAVEVDLDGDGVPDTTETVTRKSDRDRFGWYAYAEVQPWPRWLAGVRYDSTQLLSDPGREWAVEPYIGFKLSEFLRFRLAYKYTERDRSQGFTFNDVSARVANEIFLQATFILGAHPAHPF